MRVKVVLGAGLATIAGLLLVLLLDQDPRRSGGNYVPEWGPSVQLSGGRPHCEPGQLIPGDTGALNLAIGTYGRPTPRLDVTVRGPDGTLVTRGTMPAGQREGRLLVPVKRVPHTVQPDTVCIKASPGGRTVLYGRGGRVRLAWMRPGTESRLAMLPTIAHRLGLAKLNPFGSWLLLVLALVLAATWAIALRLVVREVGP
jgi:hypothetical protein